MIAALCSRVGPQLSQSAPALLLVGVCFSLASCKATSTRSATDQRSQQGPPNVILILSDDHAVRALGAYGSGLFPTPNLDRLASEGVLFENAFVTNSICAPSRAVFLTGKHSHINGVRDNGASFDGSQDTFPKRLQAAGYETAMIGKWHLKTDPTGFDHWDILPGQGHYYSPEFRSPAGKRSVPGYVTDVTTDLALEWLQGRSASQGGQETDSSGKQKPFLLMCQHKAPHRSWMPGPEHLNLFEDQALPEPATLFDDYATRTRAAHEQEMTIERHMYLEYDLKVPLLESEERQGPDRWAVGLMDRMDDAQRAEWQAAYEPRNEAFRAADLQGEDLVRWKYQRYIKNYLRCIASIDDNVGRMLDYLDESGLAENTIVIYASDQGFYLGEHGWYDKRFMYEPSLRTPLIARWPGVVPAGLRSSELVQNLDVSPTILDWTLGEELEGQQGLSLDRLLPNPSVLPESFDVQSEAWRSSIYYEYFERGIHAVSPHYGVRTQQHKLIHFHENAEWELYDLHADPEELENLYGQPQVADLQAALTLELTRLRDHYQVP